MIDSVQRVLVLAPHTDDGELGCGGTIARLIREGKSVHYAAFSLCSKSLPEGLPADTLAHECKAATAALGIPGENVSLYDWEVRLFKSHRQEILEELIKLRKKINPDLVFVPARSDVHQDHQVICEEGVRAFKNRNIFGYEMPWNNLSFNYNGFVSFNDEDLDKKIKAVNEYKSQGFRPYIDPVFLKGQARTNGLRCGADWAEAFEVIRLKL